MAMKDDDGARVELPSRFRRPWSRSDRPVPRAVVRPLERFLREEVGSGLLLLAAALVALIWANASNETYTSFWGTHLSIELGPLSFDEDLTHVVNDLLMAIFFFVVALEVKREFLFGELREPKSAAVPIATAFGTMVGGALTYVAVNLIGDGELGGWAVPIATDIAFALGALGLFGRRAPDGLRTFMLTLAVVDDLGTIVVIALFFSQGISFVWLLEAALVIATMVVLRRLGVRHLLVYVVAAGLLWVGIFESGVHATIAGVIVGFLTPAVSFYRSEDVGEVIATQLNEVRERPEAEFTDATMWDVSRLARHAVSPLARMEEAFHPWSAFVVLPIFALANAGVEVSLSGIGDAVTSPIGLGVALGLVVGAPLGGILTAWTLLRTTPATLQEGLDFRSVVAVSPLKGIGFTVAIFIALLAFDSPEAQDEAKLAILLGSAIAAGIGFVTLNLVGRAAGRRAA